MYETPRLATAWVSDDGVVRDPRECEAAKPNQAPVDPQTRLHRELIRLLLRHSLFCDQRHLVLLAQRVAVLLLRQRACFDRWIPVLPLGHGLAATCHLPAALPVLALQCTGRDRAALRAACPLGSRSRPGVSVRCSIATGLIGGTSTTLRRIGTASVPC